MQSFLIYSFSGAAGNIIARFGMAGFIFVVPDVVSIFSLNVLEIDLL